MSWTNRTINEQIIFWNRNSQCVTNCTGDEETRLPHSPQQDTLVNIYFIDILVRIQIEINIKYIHITRKAALTSDWRLIWWNTIYQSVVYQSMLIRVCIRMWFHHRYKWTNVNMRTSSKGNIFRVTGHLCGEFTGHRWFPLTKPSDAELWCFLWFVTE